MANRTLITTKDLKTGDILLSTARGKASAVIRNATASTFSHSALYIGNGRVIEAVKEGVVRPSLFDAMKDDILVSVFRYPKLTTVIQRSWVRYSKLSIG